MQPRTPRLVCNDNRTTSEGLRSFWAYVGLGVVQPQDLWHVCSSSIRQFIRRQILFKGCESTMYHCNISLSDAGLCSVRFLLK